MSQNVSTANQILNKCSFYDLLLRELLKYARKEDSKCWMPQIKRVEVALLKDQFNRLCELPMNANTLRRMQRLTDKMIRFYGDS